MMLAVTEAQPNTSWDTVSSADSEICQNPVEFLRRGGHDQRTNQAICCSQHHAKTEAIQTPQSSLIFLFVKFSTPLIVIFIRSHQKKAHPQLMFFLLLIRPAAPFATHFPNLACTTPLPRWVEWNPLPCQAEQGTRKHAFCRRVQTRRPGGGGGHQGGLRQCLCHIPVPGEPQHVLLLCGEAQAGVRRDGGWWQTPRASVQQRGWRCYS